MYVGKPREFRENSQDLLKQPPTSMRQPIKAGKMGKKPHKNQYSKVAHASFENIFENHGRRQLQGICDGVDRQ